MTHYLPLLLIPAIGYFGWTCGRAYGWAGFFIFLAALLVLAIAVFINDEGRASGQGVPMSTLVVVGLSCVLAMVTGAFGVAKRRAALQSAGDKTPKSG